MLPSAGIYGILPALNLLLYMDRRAQKLTSASYTHANHDAFMKDVVLGHAADPNLQILLRSAPTLYWYI